MCRVVSAADPYGRNRGFLDRLQIGLKTQNGDILANVSNNYIPYGEHPP
jgi:hypothetical protein